MSKLQFLAWDKAFFVQSVLQELQNIKGVAVASVKQAHATATHSENIAESRYDTLGLEGAYLAHGQAQRAIDCEMDIAAYKKMSVKNPSEAGVDERVSQGSLLCLSNNTGLQYLFLGPRAGGVKVKFYGEVVTLVTSSSPMGSTLLGKYLGDEINLPSSGEEKIFTIEGLL